MQKRFADSLAARGLSALPAWVCAAAAVGLLVGCGQKGPLTLPPPAQAASAPVR